MSCMSNKTCKDCGSGTRVAKYPGPRCHTCHYAKKRADRKRNHDRYVQKKYGLDPGDYEALYRAQGGRCYICQRATGKSKNLAVDHDHSHCSREQGCRECVRGLLCSRCNHDLLGHCRDSVEMLQRAIDYLKDPPARRFLTDEPGEDTVS